ncbi:hypothetical protein V8F33_007688 [Rhypophila sp. PSN 637]
MRCNWLLVSFALLRPSASPHLQGQTFRYRNKLLGAAPRTSAVIQGRISRMTGWVLGKDVVMVDALSPAETELPMCQIP